MSENEYIINLKSIRVKAKSREDAEYKVYEKIGRMIEEDWLIESIEVED